jgi:hypothetical protein
MPRHFLNSKLLDIPLPRRICSYREIGCHKTQTCQYRPVKQLALWGRGHSNRYIYQAFAGVMWTDDSLEPDRSWETILLEACQVLMAIMLHARCYQKNKNRHRSLRRWFCKLQQVSFLSKIVQGSWKVSHQTQIRSGKPTDSFNPNRYSHENVECHSDNPHSSPHLGLRWLRESNGFVKTPRPLDCH